MEGFPGGSDSKESAHSAGDLGSILGSGRSPGDVNVSSILAWRIPWTEEPGGLLSMQSPRVDMTEQLKISVEKLQDMLLAFPPNPVNKHLALVSAQLC